MHVWFHAWACIDLELIILNLIPWYYNAKLNLVLSTRDGPGRGTCARGYCVWTCATPAWINFVVRWAELIKRVHAWHASTPGRVPIEPCAGGLCITSLYMCVSMSRPRRRAVCRCGGHHTYVHLSYITLMRWCSIHHMDARSHARTLSNPLNFVKNWWLTVKGIGDGIFFDLWRHGSFSFNGKDMQLIRYRENIGSIN
jgi:hypothetical protein